ncbi:MAG: hypothetical protein Q9227_002539 [Pyrenula ochraceoflavens]
MAPGSNTGGEQRGPSTSSLAPDTAQRGRLLQPTITSPGLKSQFHRIGSRSRSRHAANEMAAENGTVNPNEQTPLLENASGSNEQDPNKDQSILIRWPKEVGDKTWTILSDNYVNVLLVFVPLGIIGGAIDWDPTVVFILNFLAIVPLASLLSYATEQLAEPLGQTLGGLMNATFGNAVELIVSIIALRNDEIRIVQASMLGSILSNILLVLGCCFCAGGIRYKEQTFNSTVASTMSSLMAVATASLIIPATLYAALRGSKTADSEENILILSHGTAIILLIVYAMYLFFQLKTHKEFFDAEQAAEEGEKEEAVLNVWQATLMLVIVTVLVSVCADYLVDSIDAIVTKAHLSRTFIGLILIPIVGNAAEHVTAVVVAWKDKMDLAIGVAIGSSLQIALFVTPFLVILGWIMDRAMTLRFETFETVAFFVSSLVVTLLIQDGKSNYLEGVMSLGMYVIIALAFYVYPDDGSLGSMFDGFKGLFTGN